MNTELLFEILSQPASPYREAHVARICRRVLEEGGTPYFVDPIGNIVVGVSSRQDYQRMLEGRGREPVRLFIAHMDHPGFHGVKWEEPDRLRVKWFGGTPRAHLEGASVWMADAQSGRWSGKLLEAKLIASGMAIESAVVQFETSRPKLAAKSVFGGLSFRAPVWQEGELLYTKAADDLVGTFVILTLAMSARRKKAAPFLGLLTRAEEVGFIGAIGHFELGWLKRAREKVLCVSLETSRQLPGAEIGKGPVVRLGDRANTFDSGALSVFTELAKKRLPGRHQRRIMDGGTCEATVAVAYGFRAIGISIPLGNYHNQSFEGGPDSRGSLGPAPEFVHLEDIRGMLELGDALMERGLPWGAPFQSRVGEFRAWLKKADPLLRYAP